jgi:hypothetical protein
MRPASDTARRDVSPLLGSRLLKKATCAAEKAMCAAEKIDVRG